jgi:hypothetical protein
MHASPQSGLDPNPGDFRTTDFAEMTAFDVLLLNFFVSMGKAPAWKVCLNYTRRQRQDNGARDAEGDLKSLQH